MSKVKHFPNIQEILKRSLPGYIDSTEQEMSGNIIVTVPKADSMFFREKYERGEFPLLQQITAIKNEGYELSTEWEIQEGSETYDYLCFKCVDEHYSLSLDWRAIMEINDPDINETFESAERNIEFIKQFL